MTDDPETSRDEGQTSQDGSQSLSSESPSPPLLPSQEQGALESRAKTWTPLVVQWIGIAMVLLELVLSLVHPPADTVFAAVGATMAAGGKATDIARRGGLG